MKRLLLLVLTMASSLSAFAGTVSYSNSSGCSVEVETRRNATLYYVSQGDVKEVVAVTNDFSAGSFAYCNDIALEINYLEGRNGSGIMMSCSGHQNGNAETRGRVEIGIMGGELSKISLDGQVKKIFSWKQDTKIECSNLVRSASLFLAF